MQNYVKPNEITLASVLNGCSHGGLVTEAWDIIHSMKATYGIEPTVVHYTCVVDALGRNGQLEEAEQLIRTMKSPDMVTWSSFLGNWCLRKVQPAGACRIFVDVERAERAAKAAMALDSKNPFIYVLMSNIYASAKRYEDADKMRVEMQKRGIVKTPGETWIEVFGEVVSFKAHDSLNHVAPYKQRILNQVQNLWLQ